MIASSDEARGSPQFRFRVGTLLWVMTVTAVVAQSPLLKSWEGLLLWLTLVTPAGLLIIYQIWRRRQPPAVPKETVTIQIDAKWLRRIRSPYVKWLVFSLTGVSVTFAPLYLFWCGQRKEFGAFEWLVVTLCFVVIYLVPGFYMRLAGEVIGQLVKIEKARPSLQAHPLD